jgi:hypothetical protein
MSSKNGLGKLYDKLTPKERFRLDVLAMARGDAEESEHLTRTCPKRDYIMNDWGFTGRWQGAQNLAMLAYMDVAKCLDKIHMIEAFRVTLPYLRTVWENDTHKAYFDGHHAGSAYAWSKAGKGGSPPGWEQEEEAAAERGAYPAIEQDLEKWSGEVGVIDIRILEALANLERELVEESFAAWSAFSGFCADEMVLEAKKLLAAFNNPFAQRAEELEEIAARLEIEPEQESVEEYRAILLEAWRRIVDRV